MSKTQRSVQLRAQLFELISFSVARSEDQMTEVRWFLSIQFSKSLVPWRAYQSRALGPCCQALFCCSIAAVCASPLTWGAQPYGRLTLLSTPISRFFQKPRKSAKKPFDRASTWWFRQRSKEKDGGRVPRQGRHVLDGTLDRMEGASLRGPETLPPWNQVFKVE